MRHKGIVHIFLLIFVVIAAIGGIGYLAYRNAQLNRKASVTPETSNMQTSPTSASKASKGSTYIPAPIPSIPNNWTVYSNKEYGFSFKHDPKISFVQNDLSILNKVDNGINRTEYFIEKNNSQPPTVLFGLSPNYDGCPDGGQECVHKDYFSIWTMDNSTQISPGDWYEKYVYFPLGFEKDGFDQYTKTAITIDGNSGESITYTDVIKQRLLLISHSGYMFLIHINESSVKDNQILSTLKFGD